MLRLLAFSSATAFLACSIVPTFCQQPDLHDVEKAEQECRNAGGQPRGFPVVTCEFTTVLMPPSGKFLPKPSATGPASQPTESDKAKSGAEANEDPENARTSLGVLPPDELAATVLKALFELRNGTKIFPRDSADNTAPVPAPDDPGAKILAELNKEREAYHSSVSAQLAVAGKAKNDATEHASDADCPVTVRSGGRATYWASNPCNSTSVLVVFQTVNSSKECEQSVEAVMRGDRGHLLYSYFATAPKKIFQCNMLSAGKKAVGCDWNSVTARFGRNC